MTLFILDPTRTSISSKQDRAKTYESNKKIEFIVNLDKFITFMINFISNKIFFDVSLCYSSLDCSKM